jgi:hypothetical protein
MLFAFEQQYLHFLEIYASQELSLPVKEYIINAP